MRAENSTETRSVKLKRLAAVISTSLMGGKFAVFRPPVAIAPVGVATYWALGLFTR